MISIDEKLGELQEAIEDAGTKEERDDTEEALAAYVAEREATVAAAFRARQYHLILFRFRRLTSVGVPFLLGWRKAGRMEPHVNS